MLRTDSREHISIKIMLSSFFNYFMHVFECLYIWWAFVCVNSRTYFFRAGFCLMASVNHNAWGASDFPDFHQLVIQNYTYQPEYTSFFYNWIHCSFYAFVPSKGDFEALSNIFVIWLLSKTFSDWLKQPLTGFHKSYLPNLAAIS